MIRRAEVPLPTPSPSLPGVLIPAYQPTDALSDLVETLLRDDYPWIVVVNDGSDVEHQSRFERLASLPKVSVLHHDRNQGKGQALKSGFRHILEHHPEAIGVVTVDADGQHLPPDVHRVAQELCSHPEALCLGARQFEGTIPWKSRLGNRFSHWTLRLLSSEKLKDTQTGLRGIPQAFLHELRELRSGGYDFELDMILRASSDHREIRQTPIQTVYQDNNAGSHFHPVWDSLRVSFVFFRFVLSSVMTQTLDVIVFATSYHLGASLWTATVLGRLVGGTFNFFVNQRLVFKERSRPLLEAVKYVTLVAVLMMLFYTLTSALVSSWSMPAVLAKLLVEGGLFLISFVVQRAIVFAPGKDLASPSKQTDSAVPATDWDAYYENPGFLARFTRKITTRCLLKQLDYYQGNPARARFLEYGGANSCFFDAIDQRLRPLEYRIVDLNRTGLDLFRFRHADHPRVAVEEGDVRLSRPRYESADVCYSVGLIEHFDQEGTRDAIRGHFTATRSGGLVVLFFPTPTWLYLLCRKAIEGLGMWGFPDERPLSLHEVLTEAEKHGKVLATGINWWILLTQGYVVIQVEKNLPGR